MLRGFLKRIGQYDKVVAIGLLVVYALGYAFLVGRSSQHQENRKQIEMAYQASKSVDGQPSADHRNPQQKITGNQASKGSDHAAEIAPFGIKLGEALLFFATVWLVLVTGALVRGTDDTAKKQLRAYVSAEPDGIVEFLPNDRVVARVRFQNTGSVFAKAVRSKIKKQLSDDGDLPDDAFPIDKTELVGDNVMAPRAEILYATDAIQKTDISSGRTAAKQVDKSYYLYVWGMIEYDDGFASTRFTKFCHRYNFSSLAAGEYILLKENYRYHHNGNRVDG
jgi:hypothetical protein